MTQSGTANSEDADIHQDAAGATIATRRNRSLLFATATSGLAKLISVALNAITIPIVVRALGADGFGLWTTITSISSFLVFADFGLSNGLVAVVSEATGKRDRNAAIRAVSTTFFVLLALAAVFSALVAIAIPLVPWAGLLHLTHSRLAPDVNAAVAWFVVLQIANLPALVSQKVQIGYQEMHWTNSWQIVGSALSFVGVLVAAWKGLGLVQFIVLFSLGPLLAQILGSYVLFSRLRPWLAPRVSAFQWDCVRDLGGTGGIFVLLQLFSVLGTSSDQFILARYLGLTAVAEYSITQRLFTGASLVQFFLVPLWPAFGEALASGDHVWARMALRRTLWISLALSTVCAVLIASVAPAISTAWVPQIQKASPLLLCAFVASSLFTAYIGTMSVFLNNRKTIRAQLGFCPVASLAALIAKLVLVQVLGISGVLWGTVLGYGLFYAYPAWRLTRNTLDNLQPRAVELQVQ
jgi:O-antigen/teichoic acid export membrane protein